MRYLLGVDEAGRGPLAGPVAVGVVAVAAGFDVAKAFPGVRDSKQLTPQARERLFEQLKARVATGDARYRVAYGSYREIDERGIATAIKRAVRRGVLALIRDWQGLTLSTLAKSDFAQKTHILLDGGLRAPSAFSQETIIRGDSLIPLISLASIAAKVSRDRLMCRLAKQYPVYDFDKHKGYPTKAHYAALALHGPSPIHRRSFLHLDRASLVSEGG